MILLQVAMISTSLVRGEIMTIGLQRQAFSSTALETLRRLAHGAFAALGVVGAAVVAAPPSPGVDGSSVEIQKYRQTALQFILTDHPATEVAVERGTCLAGRQPDAIRDGRAEGWRSPPDASDLCASVGLRMGRDGTLLQPYRELLSKLTGSSEGYEQLPAAMAAAVMKGGVDRVEIGHGKAALLTPAWALDAGFTVAYQGRAGAPAGAPTIAAVKPIAERCLALQERDLGLCYSTGYMYGARAANGTLLAALGLGTR